MCWGLNNNGQIGDGAITTDTQNNNRLAPVVVPSFILNIDPAVLLSFNQRVATVNIVATCPAGDFLHVDVKLLQGSVTGAGVEQRECTGRIEKYPVTVAAQGRDGFSAGAAKVQVVADIREGGVIIDTEQDR